MKSAAKSIFLTAAGFAAGVLLVKVGTYLWDKYGPKDSEVEVEDFDRTMQFDQTL